MLSNEGANSGSNINQIKLHNMRAVLLSLLHQEPAYRVEIAAETSLSTTTITNLIDELIESGVVAEQGVEEFSGRRRVGRPRSALFLVKDARCALGVQIGVETYRIAIANLKAEIISYRQYSFSRTAPPAEIFQDITRNISNLIEENHLDRKRIIGIGVGAAGLVNYHTGINLLSYNLGWENVPIRDWLAEGLNLPVVVDNNVKAMALGEAFFGVGRQVNSLVFVYGRAGVGSGIVIGNRLLRGADLGAGEIGHMILMAQGGKKCRCGQNGCLETLVSEPALLDQAQEVALANPAGALAAALNSGEGWPSERLFAAARKWDPQALEIVDMAAHYLGIALANLVNLLNPQMIVLGGLFSQGGDLLLPATRATLKTCAFAGLGDKVDLRTTCFGWQAGIVGAASLALTNLFYLNPEQI